MSQSLEKKARLTIFNICSYFSSIDIVNILSVIFEFCRIWSTLDNAYINLWCLNWYLHTISLSCGSDSVIFTLTGRSVASNQALLIFPWDASTNCKTVVDHVRSCVEEEGAETNTNKCVCWRERRVAWGKKIWRNKEENVPEEKKK